MESLIFNSENSFTLFYFLSFAVFFLLILFHAVKQGYSLRSLLLILSTITLLAIVGSRLFTIPINDWGSYLLSDSNKLYTNRSALGALLFGLIGLLICVQQFILRKLVLVHFAWITTLTLGIQKMGCFFNGCCYGKPTNSLFGIQYELGSPAHFDHFVNGMLESSSLTQHLHPVQLYESLYFFIAALLIWKTRNFWKQKYSVLLVALSLFLIFRFGIEFVRDPMGSQFQQTIGGMRVLQLGLLFLGTVGFVLLYFYEKKYRSQNWPTGNGKIENEGTFAVVLAVVFLLSKYFLSDFEFITTACILIPAITLVGINKLKAASLHRQVWLTTGLVLFPLLLITQTTSEYGEQKETYKRIDFGTSFGSTISEIVYNRGIGECGTTYSRDYYEHAYTFVGGGFSIVNQTSRSTNTYGLMAYGGNNKETNVITLSDKSYFIWGAKPYYKYDGNWFGFGAGIHFGNLRWIPDDELDESTYDSGTKSGSFYPAYSLRIGRRDILDLSFEHGFNFPTPFPAFMDQVSIGSGFGQKNDFSLRYGKVLPSDISYISAEGIFNKNWGAKIQFYFNDNEYDYMDANTNLKLVFGINYRFGHKKK